MVTKKKLEADLAAANEALEAEKQKAAAAAKAHDDKVKELSGKIKDLEAAAAASTKESAAAIADAKAAGAKEAEQALQKTLDGVRAQLDAATSARGAAERPGRGRLETPPRSRRRRRHWPLRGGVGLGPTAVRPRSPH